LAACVGTVPVTSTDQVDNTDRNPLVPASDSIEKDNAPGKDDTAPPLTKVASSHMINLEPVVEQIRMDQKPTSISGNDPWQARTVPLNVKYTAAQPPAEVIGQSLPENIGTNREHSSTQVTYGQEDDESVFVRTAYKGGELFTVGSSFTRNKQVDDFEAPIEEDHGYWHMKMSSAAGSPGPGIEAEFAQSSFDPDTSEGFGVSENRLIKLSTNSAWQGFTVGVGYQSVGENFELGGKTASGHKKNDNNPQKKLRKGRQGTEAWVSRQFGNLGVKTLASVYQDKPDGDDNVPHFTTHKVGSSLNYTISSWPSAGITLDYGSGVRGSSNEADGFQPMEVSVENIASSLYYSDESWIGTFYVENATGEGSTNIANLRTYWLGGAYFPISTFSVTPSVSYVKEEYPEFDVTTDSFATSMTVSYKPSTNSRFNYTGYSEYSTEKNRDWAMDSEYMYSSLGINWDSKKPRSLIKKMSLELFHDQYTDNLYSDNSTAGVGVMLKLRSTTSPLRRITEEVR
jgi:hypothetical protein